MKKIWNYEDYVTRLKHPDSAVRDWAFRGLEERYRNKYTDEVASLIGDENTHLACMAPRYLARHSAEQHAEKILTCFQNSEGNVRSNCAMALGRLKYEPAVDSMRELFLSSKRGDSFFGLLDYFANVDLDDCRELLREAMDQLSDPFELEAVATSLLRHFQPQDTEVIVDSCLTQIIETNSTDRFLQRIANVLSGEGYFREITEGQFDILEQPKECIDHLFSNNPSLSPSTDLLPGLIKALADGRIAEFTTMIMFAAKTILQKRYPKKTIADWLVETHNKDKTTLALLETLTKRSALWEAMDNCEHSGQNMVALVLAALCGILDRQNTLPALAPEATLDDLLQALARAGSDFPKVLRDKIIAAQPESELSELLTNELLTWGDIWVVQLMGKIAYPAFIPHLLRVINETDGLSYIHDHALTAINCIADEEGDKHLLEAIQNRKVDDSISSMSILSHLSYEEAYDLALEKWHNEEDDIDDHETFAVCLEGIGDPRGVKTLQNIYKHETTHAGVGDPLECLARLHDMDIPELATIAAQRQGNEEFRKNRATELAQLARNYERNKDRDAALPAQILPFKRETSKVGRNEPCPCGSGKKYKKCCLRK